MVACFYLFYPPYYFWCYIVKLSCHRPSPVKPKHLSHILLVSFVYIFTLGCVGNQTVTVAAPAWVNELPRGESVAVGSASYEIFGEAKARENATMKALSALALQKGGVVDLKGKVENIQTVDRYNGQERISDRSAISTKITIKGKDIPIRGRVHSYWKDTTARRVWVLVVEEK